MGAKPAAARNFINGWAKKYVPDPAIIFDVGALNGNQSVEFAEAYPDAQVYCFEAHPEHAAICRKVTAAYPNITVVEGAVGNTDGETVTFWATKQNNPGGSSLYKFTDKMIRAKKFKQHPIEVETLSLDTWAQGLEVPAPDILWVDLQGNEGPMLDGMHDLLRGVTLVHTEAHLEPAYHGQTMFDEISWHLRNAGLKMKHWIPTRSVVNCGDAIFLRED
jgi:FkbM family methyltransferase